MKNLKSPLRLILTLSLFCLFFIFSCKEKEKEIIDMEEPAVFTMCLAEIDGIFQEVTLDSPPNYLDGGFDGFLTNIYGTISYPAEARENGIEGSTSANYEITEEGKVENIEIIENPGGGIGEALKSTLEEITMGVSFSPGILDGSPVRIQKKVSANFKLQG